MKFDLDLSTDYDILSYKNMKSININNYSTDLRILNQNTLTDYELNEIKNDFDFFTNDHWILCLL